MILEPPTNYVALIESRFEQLFASSTSLWERTEKPAETVLADHVMSDYAWYEEAGESGLLRSMRPLVILDWHELTISRIGYNSSNGSQENLWNGRVEVTITDNALHAGSIEHRLHRESRRDFVNFSGGVIQDVAEMAGRDSNAGFREASIVFPWERTPMEYRSSDNDFWTVVLGFDIGHEQ